MVHLHTFSFFLIFLLSVFDYTQTNDYTSLIDRYVLRAIYVTKGSSLLPPSFASIFDDSASSVIDVFFDPSDGSLNLPGLTIGKKSWSHFFQTG